MPVSSVIVAVGSSPPVGKVTVGATPVSINSSKSIVNVNVLSPSSASAITLGLSSNEAAVGGVVSMSKGPRSFVDVQLPALSTVAMWKYQSPSDVAVNVPPDQVSS